jgi:hypothetical protein
MENVHLMRESGASEQVTPCKSIARGVGRGFFLPASSGGAQATRVALVAVDLGGP